MKSITQTSQPLSTNYVTKQDLNQALEKQTKEFTSLVHNLMIEIGLKFDETDNNFDKMNKKFEIIDSKFDKIDKKFEIIDSKFDKIDKRFEIIDSKFDKIDKRFEKTDIRFKELKKLILDGNLTIIEELQASREEQITLSYRQRKHTDKLEEHDSRISILEKNYQITT